MDSRDPQLLDDVHGPPEGSGAPGDRASSGEPATPEGLGGVAATGARRKRRRRSATRNAIEWAVVLVGALAVALVVKTWLFQAFYIPSQSMEPTLEVGDRVLVNKFGYDVDDLRRGHIIVFARPEGWSTGEIDDLIKRVIALPGETVSARDGQILIDGEPLDEPWLDDAMVGRTPDFGPDSGCVPECTLEDDEVFVLGDNRTNSSASNIFGPFDFDEVVGRAVIRVWPLDALGGI